MINFWKSFLGNMDKASKAKSKASAIENNNESGLKSLISGSSRYRSKLTRSFAASKASLKSKVNLLK